MDAACDSDVRPRRLAGRSLKLQPAEPPRYVPIPLPDNAEQLLKSIQLDRTAISPEFADADSRRGREVAYAGARPPSTANLDSSERLREDRDRIPRARIPTSANGNQDRSQRREQVSLQGQSVDRSEDVRRRRAGARSRRNPRAPAAQKPQTLDQRLGPLARRVAAERGDRRPTRRDDARFAGVQGRGSTICSCSMARGRRRLASFGPSRDAEPVRSAAGFALGIGELLEARRCRTCPGCGRLDAEDAAARGCRSSRCREFLNLSSPRPPRPRRRLAADPRGGAAGRRPDRVRRGSWTTKVVGRRGPAAAAAGAGRDRDAGPASWRAFEALALNRFGSDARPWNHRLVAHRFGGGPAIDSLTRLYEQARYAPGDASRCRPAIGSRRTAA